MFEPPGLDTDRDNGFRQQGETRATNGSLKLESQIICLQAGRMADRASLSC
jgi:hypothetical protein